MKPLPPRLAPALLILSLALPQAARSQSAGSSGSPKMPRTKTTRKAPGKGSQAASKKRVVSGTILSISSSVLSIKPSRASQGVMQSIRAPANVVVLAAGLRMPRASLRPGQQVTVRVNSAGRAAVIEVAAKR